MKRGNELWVISDIHVAHSWDEINKIIKGKIRFLNPNKELKRFIRIANKDNKLAGIVINGDAVDYFFQKLDISRKRRASNWTLLYSILKDLKKPFFEVPGNHDYRREPYNYAIYGLKHVNISSWIRRKFADQIGHNNFRWLKEWSSVGVNERLFNPFKKYKGIRYPKEKKIGKFKCLFLDSGSDANIRARDWLKCLEEFFYGKRLVIELDGPKERDVNFLAKSLGDKKREDIYVFMHAPIISPFKNRINKKYQLSLTNFLASAARQRIDHETIINNRERILDIFRRSNKNIIFIASHIHEAKYFLIDKDSLEARQVSLKEINKNLKNPRYIKHITTWALGEIPIERKLRKKKKTGFLKITSKGIKEIVTNDFT